MGGLCFSNFGSFAFTCEGGVMEMLQFGELGVESVLVRSKL